MNSIEWNQFTGGLLKETALSGNPLNWTLPGKALTILEKYLLSLPESQAEKIRPKIALWSTAVLNELGLGSLSLAAVFLIKPYSEGWIESEQVRDEFNGSLADILDGLRKIDRLNTSRTRIHADKFIQLLLGISHDVRVILIKTGEQLVEIRLAGQLDPASRQKIAHEAIDLYAPVAHRLGLYLVKNELEDLAMNHLHPDIYADLSRRLDETRADRDEYISRFVGPLKKRLEENDFHVDIKGRTKSIPSIWRKMVQQGVEFEEVYDLFAIRIILNNPSTHEKADCWQLYSIVTDSYQPNPNRLRDWISSPKANGYESLHTTVIGPEGRWVEVQIRTRRMDEIAEKGHAAHWRYKENSGETESSEWLAEIRDALETQDITANEVDYHSKQELYTHQIFIFTPKGDLLKLTVGSTVLDFAFAVHSEVGFHCTGARVNGVMVPIRYKLMNGDLVEVMTSQQQKPKTDWLNMVTSPKARAKIKRYLKEAEYQDTDIGKEMLKRKLGQWRIKFDVSTIQRIVNWLNLKDALELYQQIADDRIDLAAIREYLRDKAPAELLKEKLTAVKSVEGFVKTSSRQQDYLVIDDKLNNVDYRLAKCCNPIFGDEVFGFVTVKDGTKVHRINCPNAPQMIERYPYRVVKVRWSEHHATEASFTVNVVITGRDDMSVVNEISRLISSDLKISMRSMNITPKEGLFEGTYTLIVQDRPHLETIMNRIRRTKGVLSVRRSDE
ncbi:MAG: RelA/SpoT family protein [Bacteroidota bacterium]